MIHWTHLSINITTSIRRWYLAVGAFSQKGERMKTCFEKEKTPELCPAAALINSGHVTYCRLVSATCCTASCLTNTVDASPWIRLGLWSISNVSSDRFLWAPYHKAPRTQSTLLVINDGRSEHWMAHRLNHSWDLDAEEQPSQQGWLMNKTPASSSSHLFSHLAGDAFTLKPEQKG